MQARRVESGKPHIADDDKLEWIVWIPEPLRQRFAPIFGASVLRNARSFGRIAGHDNLDRTAR